MMTLIREPLLHFLLIGAALFFIHGWRGNTSSSSGGQTGAQAAAQIIVSRAALDQGV